MYVTSPKHLWLSYKEDSNFARLSDTDNQKFLWNKCMETLHKPKCVTAIALIQFFRWFYVICYKIKTWLTTKRVLNSFAALKAFPSKMPAVLEVYSWLPAKNFQILPLDKTLKVWRQINMLKRVNYVFYWILLNPAPHISPVAWITTNLWIF